MSPEGAQTAVLLDRWHAGDQESLDILLRRHMPWIQARVHQRLGDRLRGKAETCDFVQDALSELLRYLPRFRIQNEVSFRALMARIVENALRDRHDWFRARRRDMDLERPLPDDSVLDLGPRSAGDDSPSQILMQNEREAWIRLGIELLDPQDRDVLVLREWDELSFPEIGGRLEISEDAARKRFHRALPRLATVVDALRRGELETVLEE